MRLPRSGGVYSRRTWTVSIRSAAFRILTNDLFTAMDQYAVLKDTWDTEMREYEEMVEEMDGRLEEWKEKWKETWRQDREEREKKRRPEASGSGAGAPKNRAFVDLRAPKGKKRARELSPPVHSFICCLFLFF